MDKHTRVTLHSVAKAARLSANTVSRALGDKDGVSEMTREKVKKLATEMNYRPNLLAKSMRQKRTGFIGVQILDIGNIVFTRMVKGIEDRTVKKSLSIIIGNSDSDAAKESMHLETMLSVQCRGIIISHMAKSALQLLRREAVPFVVLDRDTDGLECDRVFVDHESMGYLATKHLLELGHREIAVITRQPLDAELQARIDGHNQALRENALEPRSDRIYLCGDSSQGSTAFEALWRNPNRPTALVIGQHNIGEGTILTMNRLGVRVPEELSVVVIGEPTWAALTPQGITTVERPLEEMGAKAAELLFRRLEGGTAPPNICEAVSAQLVKRGSTAPAR